MASGGLLHPHPRTRNDVREIALGSPSQHALSLRWIGHQHRRIARPPRSHLSPNRMSGGVFRCADDFENGMSAACPQIEGQRVFAFSFAAFFKVLQCSDVRIRRDRLRGCSRERRCRPESGSRTRRFADQARSWWRRRAPVESGEFPGVAGGCRGKQLPRGDSHHPPFVTEGCGGGAGRQSLHRKVPDFILLAYSSLTGKIFKTGA